MFVLANITVFVSLFSKAIAQAGLCDRYTNALFTDNNAANQYQFLVKFVNTALIGNYTPGAKNVVTGVLVPGEYNGAAVSLLPYFNGGLLSTNSDNQSKNTNFLDDGGALALAKGLPATGISSNQYSLVTHLYQYFGAGLQCSQYNTSGFLAYQGNANMFDVHKFMNIDPNEFLYFAQQFADSLASLGGDVGDSSAISSALIGYFAYRCSPATALLPAATPNLQAICINAACSELPANSSPVCTAYNTRPGGVGIDPSTATTTPGPQQSDIATQLRTIENSLGLASQTTGSSSAAVTSSSGSSTIAPSSFTTTIVQTNLITSGSVTETQLITGVAVLPIRTSTNSANGPTGSPTPSAKESNTGAIAGGVVGGVIALAVVIGLGLFVCRRRRQRPLGQSAPIDPTSRQFAQPATEIGGNPIHEFPSSQNSTQQTGRFGFQKSAHGQDNPAELPAVPYLPRPPTQNTDVEKVSRNSENSQKWQAKAGQQVHVAGEQEHVAA